MRIQKKALEHSKEEQGLIVPQCTGEVMDFVLPQMGRKILHVVGIVWKSVSEAIGTAIGRDVEVVSSETGWRVRLGDGPWRELSGGQVQGTMWRLHGAGSSRVVDVALDGDQAFVLLG